MRNVLVSTLVVTLLSVGCSRRPDVTAEPASATATSSTHQETAARVGNDPGHAGHGTPLTPAPGHELAAFAAGCFWGVEDAFRHVPGVIATAPGYAGGHTDGPSYEEVSSHATGHAETVLVEFDPTRVRYEHLLRVFWAIHDPTQGDRQGPDVGSNYRSVVFTLSDAQAQSARASLEAERPKHRAAITTSVTPLGRFWIAEAYHQQYSERTGEHSCPIRLPDTL